MDTLLNKILSNSTNKKVLEFLNIDLKKEKFYFVKWIANRNSPDEGGTALFDNYGQEVPEECKYTFERNNIMINPSDGHIFAFHTGRFSIFFRCDFERSNLINSDDYRKGFTFDCISDITELGENWSFLNASFEDEEETQFRWAYEKAINKG